MKNIKSYKFFESNISEYTDDVRDILIELEDDGFHIEIYSTNKKKLARHNKLSESIGILIRKVRESNHSVVDGVDIITILERLISYLSDNFHYYYIMATTLWSSSIRNVNIEDIKHNSYEEIYFIFKEDNLDNIIIPTLSEKNKLLSTFNKDFKIY